MCETTAVLGRWTLRELWEGVALVAVCALVLSACGGGDNGTTQAQTETQTTARTQTTGQTETEATGSTGSPNTVSAERYVSSICSSLKASLRQNKMSVKEFRASISATSSAADVRKSFVAYFDDVITSTERLALRVSRAGTPDVKGGDQAAAEIRRSLRDAKALFVRLRVQVTKLPVDDVTALSRRLQEINSSLQPQLAALGETFERLSTESGAELQRAVKDTPACAGL
jgi:hypothetical protein